MTRLNDNLRSTDGENGNPSARQPSRHPADGAIPIASDTQPTKTQIRRLPSVRTLVRQPVSPPPDGSKADFQPNARPIASPPIETVARLKAPVTVARQPVNASPVRSEELPKQPVERKASLPSAATIREKSLRTSLKAEWVAPVRWWNAMPLSIFLSLGVLGYAWITVENLLASLELTRLLARLDNPQLDRRRLADDLSTRVESPLSRFDGRRDYVVARVLTAIEESQNKPSMPFGRPENAHAVYHNVSRAVQRSPANSWYRLTRALLAERFDWEAQEKENNWKVAEKLANAEPVFWHRWADHLRSIDKTDDAIADYRTFLMKRPEQTSELLKSLAESRLPVSDQMRVVPDRRIALGQAVAYFKDLGVGDWKSLAEKMLALPKSTDKYPAPEEQAAEALVAQAMGQNELATDLYRTALKRRPQRFDWKQRLAHLLFDRREYADAARLADSIIKADPGGELAGEARQLRDRIALAMGSSNWAKAN